MAYGDPHFITFDGNDFTFNGYGEFWLFKAEFVSHPNDNLNIQIRMLPPEAEPRKNISTNQNTPNK